MAQAMTSMTGLCGSVKLPNLKPRNHTSANRKLEVRAQHTEDESMAQTGRRVALGLVAAGLVCGSFANAVLADGKPIKLGPPPPPSGGLPGTENSDQARDFNLPLKDRFYLQPLPPQEATARVKESAKDILSVKELIDKKAWPYVMNDLRSKASYLRYDLKTITDAKPKEEKKAFKELTDKLFKTINDLDYAAKIKSSEQAEKYYAETKSALDDVLAKLG